MIVYRRRSSPSGGETIIKEASSATVLYAFAEHFSLSTNIAYRYHKTNPTRKMPLMPMYSLSNAVKLAVMLLTTVLDPTVSLRWFFSQSTAHLIDYQTLMEQTRTGSWSGQTSALATSRFRIT